MIEITISNDPSTIGPEATADELEQFGSDLAATLASEFGVDVRCRFASVSRSDAGATDGEYETAERVRERLLEIEQGDEWLRILEHGPQ